MGIIYKNGIAYGNQRVLDATLTQQGEDADAKAVGDALALKAGTGVIADDFSTSQSYAIGDYTYYNGSLYRFTAAHSAGAWVGTDAQAVQLAEDVVDLKNTLNHKADVIYDTASGDIASFPDGADGLPVKGLTVTIEPVQSGTGDPSPTNVRPISGWTGCNISHSGADTSDPTVIPISWQSEAGTIYGGTLDVINGRLTVTMAEVDLGTLTWIYDTQYTRFYTNLPSMVYKPVRTAPFVCSLYQCINDGRNLQNVPDKSIYNGDMNVYVHDSDYTDAATFKASMSGVQLVYELVTPQTYQLDPVTVSTLLGQNNVWADCGPSTVEYPADTKLYIQKINTPTDDDMIADAQIASGKYFIVNNNLYLSTTTILAGDPIKPGTNCTLTNLAAALNALNS